MRPICILPSALAFANAVSAATLYLAGDSTMALNTGGVIQGWGTQVGKYLNIAVVNDAVGGTSSRTFTTSGLCELLIIVHYHSLTQHSSRADDFRRGIGRHRCHCSSLRDFLVLLSLK